MAATKKDKTTPEVEDQDKTTLEQPQEGQEGAGGAGEGEQPTKPEGPAEGKNEGEKGGTAKAAPEEGGCDCWVYIGPSLPGGRLNQNHVMRGTRKAVLGYLAQIIGDFPQVERLTVSLDRLAEQKARVRDGKTAAHKYYQDVVSAINALSKKEE